MLKIQDLDTIRDIAADVLSEIGARAAITHPFPVMAGNVADVLGLSYEDAAGFRFILWEGNAVAGVMDRQRESVIVAGDLPRDWKLTTALHLIAMSIVSDARSHADLPITGIERVTTARRGVELAADFLAIEIAAPSAAVEAEFLDRFGWAYDDRADPGWLAENLRVGVSGLTGPELGTCGRRRRAFIYSSANGFGRRFFAPLNEVFGISPAAMGLRLEEIGLVS